MNEDTPYLRNHWSMVVSSILKVLLALAFIIVIAVANGMPAEILPYYALFISLILALVVVWNIIIWKKTRYYFLDDEIVVLRDTVFRKELRIQYERLASVNVQRDFICRILGTAKLAFNLNSNVNVLQAEAFIVLKEEDAEVLRKDVYKRMFQASNGTVGTDDGTDVPDTDSEAMLQPQYAGAGVTPLEDAEPLVHISTFDIFLHSIIGMPSIQALFGVLMAIYSIVTFFMQGAISILPLVILIAEFVLPAVGTFIRYYGYRLVRVGDTVSVSSGLFSTRSDSFKLSKVNFVRVREPLFCRLAGRAILEAEVVGTANENGIPLLCPTKKKDIVMGLFHDLLPEFECNEVHEKQSKTSLATIGLYMAVYLSILAVITYLISSLNLGVWGILLYIAVVILVVYIAVWGFLAYRNYSLAMDEDILKIVTGAYDRSVNYVLFDKIQYATVRSSPLQRRHGDGRCKVSMLSSRGFTEILSGVFKAEVLEKISATVMARIRDGRYDFRRYQ